MTRVKDVDDVLKKGRREKMTYENEKVQMPADNNTQAEENLLQIEELESRVAPSAVWGD